MLVVSSPFILIPVTSKNQDDALSMDYLVVKWIRLLESSTPYDVFELSKESDKLLDAACFPFLIKARIFG